MQDYTLSLADEAATLHLGQTLAQNAIAPCVIYLNGDLGAGKTTFARGFLQGVGYEGIVKSPTYTLVESYALTGRIIHHLDLYRFTDPEEWFDAGLDELITQESILLVEWPQKAAGVLPVSDIDIALSVHNQGRMCTITSHSINAEQCLLKWSISHAEI